MGQRFNTTAFIKAFTERMCEILPTYYEEAPTRGTFPYSVFNGINIIDLSAGDLLSFYLDIWVDEKKPGATEELESLCDTIRTELYNAIIAAPGFASHIGFDNQNIVTDGEHDIAHRRLGMSARIFYY